MGARRLPVEARSGILCSHPALTALPIERNVLGVMRGVPGAVGELLARS